MTIKPLKATLKNGKTVLLKSPEEADALALLLHTKKTAAETHFLVKTAAEAEKLSLEKEKVLINAVNESKDSFIIAAESRRGTGHLSAWRSQKARQTTGLEHSSR